MPPLTRAGNRIKMPATRDGTRWTPEQIQLQRWLALPRDERIPATLELLARTMGQGDATLWRWRQLPGFGDAVVALMREHVKTDKLADVMNSQIRKATRDEDTPAARFVFEAAGALASSTDPTDRRIQIAIVTDRAQLSDGQRTVNPFED